MLEIIQNWDTDFLIYLNRLGNKSWYSVWLWITSTITWTPLFILIIFLLFKTFHKRQAFLVFIYMLFAALVNVALMLTIKFIVERPRPINVPEIKEALYLFKEASSYGFYSGHASFSFLIATLSTLLLRKKYRRITWIYLFPVFFCYSRIYFGVHYISDILVGAAVGIAIAVFANKRINTALHQKVL